MILTVLWLACWQNLIADGSTSEQHVDCGGPAQLQVGILELHVSHIAKREQSEMWCRGLKAVNGVP
jgi:hypothetical protein